MVNSHDKATKKNPLNVTFFHIRTAYSKKQLIKGLKRILCLAVSFLSNSPHFSELYFLQEILDYVSVSQSLKRIPLVSPEVIISGILYDRVTQPFLFNSAILIRVNSCRC